MRVRDERAGARLKGYQIDSQGNFGDVSPDSPKFPLDCTGYINVMLHGGGWGGWRWCHFEQDCRTKIRTLVQNDHFVFHFLGHCAVEMQVSEAGGRLRYREAQEERKGSGKKKRRKKKREEGTEDIAFIQYRCAP